MPRPANSSTYKPSAADIGDDRVSERIAEYEAEFDVDDITTIDRAQIKRMAKLELAADDATNELTSRGDLTPAQRKALGDTAKSLSAEARQLADSLGMSRAKRLNSEQADQEQFIPKIYREAREFIYQHAVCIICPKCREEEAHVEIIAGSIIYHFTFESQWTWTSLCPRCGNRFEINQDNYLEFLFTTINKVVVSPRAINLEEEEDDQEEI
jgi:Zn finger protein HypA/HybF involved in hydrogenase expression